MKPEYHFRFSPARGFRQDAHGPALLFPARLHLVDAVTAMEGNGPGSGDPRHLGLVLGCEDPFALDEVLRRSHRLRRRPHPGCRPGSWAASPPTRSPARDPAAFHIPDFVLPPRRGTLFQMLLPGKAGEALSRVLQSAMAPRPTLTPAKCVGCGKCAAICPAQGHNHGKS